MPVTDQIAVLPASPAYATLVHPVDGPVTAEGSLWSYDGFTCRMLTDGAIIRKPLDEGSKGKDVEAKADESKQPNRIMLVDEIDPAPGPLATPAPATRRATGA